jgi:hypothetical protein
MSIDFHRTTWRYIPKDKLLGISANIAWMREPIVVNLDIILPEAIWMAYVRNRSHQ